jgi:hypothetical protein
LVVILFAWRIILLDQFTSIALLKSTEQSNHNHNSCLNHLVKELRLYFSGSDFFWLLRDAILRTLQAAEIAGIRAILVPAISEDAKAFYERCGFTASPVDPMTLMTKVKDALFHTTSTNSSS